MLAETWHRVYTGGMAQGSAFWRNASMWRAYLKISRHLAFFPRILMARGALLDMYFGQCSYYRSQTLCCCYKYHVLSNFILCNLISSAIVDDLVIFYFFYFDLYTTWAKY